MVNSEIVEIILKAVDNVDGPVKQAEDAINKFGNTVEQANQKSISASEKYNQKLQQTSNKLDKTVENVNKVGNEGSKSFQNLSKSQQDAVTKFNMLDKSTQTTLQAIREVGIESKNMFPDADKALSSFSQLDNLTRSWSGSLDYAKTKMQLLGNDTTTLRGKIQTTGMAIQTYLGTKWDGIKNKVSSVAQSIKGKIGGAIDTVKAKLGGLSGGFSKIKSGATSAGKGLGFLSGAASMTVGMIGFELVNGLVEAGRNSINASKQMDYFTNRLGMSAQQTAKFKTEIGDMQKEFRKVDMTAVGATAADLSARLDLPISKLGEVTKMTAVMSSEFVRNGSTQENAVLAVADAMDGQFKRLQEIGITQDMLMKNGWNGDLNDKAGLVDALNKSMEKLGYADIAKDITTLDEAFGALSIAGGQLLASILIPITPALVSIVEGLIGLGDAVRGLPDWALIAAGITGVGLAIIFLAPLISGGLMSALVSFGSVVGVTIIPEMATLSGALFTVAGAAWAAIAPFLPFIAIAAAIAIAVYEVGKAFGWWNDIGSMIDAITTGVQRLWKMFMNNKQVKQFIKELGDAWNSVCDALKPVVDWAHKVWNDLFPNSAEGKFDIVRWIAEGFGWVARRLAGIVGAAKSAWSGLMGFINYLSTTGGIIGTVRDALKGIVCILLGCSPGIVPALKTVQEVFTTVWNAIAGFVSGVISRIITAFQPVIDILTLIGEFIIGQFMESWQSLVWIFDMIGQHLNLIILTFQEFLSGQITLQGMLSQIWNIIQSLFSTVLNIIINRVISFGSSLFNLAISVGSGFVNGFISWIRQLPGKVYSFLVQTTTRIVTQGRLWVNKARAIAQQLVTGVINWFKQLPGKVYSVLYQVVSKIISAGQQWVSNAKAKASSVVSSVYNTLTGLPGKIASALSGVVNAITKPFTNAYNKVCQEVDKIKDKASELTGGLLAFGGDDYVPVGSMAGVDLSQNSNITTTTGVDHNLTGELTLIHDLRNLPEGITAEDVANLINETATSDEFGKNLARNMSFQEYDLSVKQKIIAKTNRARGI